MEAGKAAPARRLFVGSAVRRPHPWDPLQRLNARTAFRNAPDEDSKRSAPDDRGRGIERTYGSKFADVHFRNMGQDLAVNGGAIFHLVAKAALFPLADEAGRR